MPKTKVSLDTLREYLPANTYELVVPLLNKHKVHLTITRMRQTKLGDFRSAYEGSNHRISINGNLNKYSFLLTLLHELAHLLAYEKYGHKIQSHGKEWKHVYAGVLKTFLAYQIFPADIVNELQLTIHNPSASSCAEESLQRVLMRYDEQKPGVIPVEKVEVGKKFRISNGMLFQKGEKIRKRYKCIEVATGRIYLFSPIYEVFEI